ELLKCPHTSFHPLLWTVTCDSGCTPVTPLQDRDCDSVVRVDGPAFPPLRAGRIRRAEVACPGHECAGTCSELAREGFQPALADKRVGGGRERPVEVIGRRWIRGQTRKDARRRGVDRADVDCR